MTIGEFFFMVTVVQRREHLMFDREKKDDFS